MACAVYVLSTEECVAWGRDGHRIISHITSLHLTPEAKAALVDLLGSQSLADISTWADEIRNEADLTP